MKSAKPLTDIASARDLPVGPTRLAQPISFQAIVTSHKAVGPIGSLQDPISATFAHRRVDPLPGILERLAVEQGTALLIPLPIPS